MMQSCFRTMQVRCVVVGFGTISIRYVLVKPKLVYACSATVSVIRCMCTHSGTICPSFYRRPVRHQLRRDVTRHFHRPFGNLPGFKYRRVICQKKLLKSGSIISVTQIVWARVPLKNWSPLVSDTICASIKTHATGCRKISPSLPLSKSTTTRT